MKQPLPNLKYSILTIFFGWHQSVLVTSNHLHIICNILPKYQTLKTFIHYRLHHQDLLTNVKSTITFSKVLPATLEVIGRRQDPRYFRKSSHDIGQQTPNQQANPTHTKSLRKTWFQLARYCTWWDHQNRPKYRIIQFKCRIWTKYDIKSLSLPHKFPCLLQCWCTVA